VNSESRRAAVICASLIALVFVLYAKTRTHEFLTWDDPAYVTDNQVVLGGVSAAGVGSALTETLHGNWHPVTVISHMVDVQLFGVAPGAHHLVNVAFHAANTALLFLVLLQLTGASLQSALAAALFAAHPLNVETVAWIAERKSLLSLFFGLLAICFYVSWTRKASVRRYIALLACFALSLMSKAMLVTLPLLLVVLDMWPLERLRTLQDLPARLREKMPLFVLSVSCALITLVAQRSAGAVSTAIEIPLRDRLLNALVSIAWYPLKTVWPANLNSLYLHPSLGGHPVSSMALAASVAFALILIAAVILLRCAPVTAGVLWYVIALLPVIGIVQAGYQAHADRYAYIPLIGLFIGVAFVPIRDRRAISALLLIAAGACSFATWRLVDTWKNDRAVYLRAIRIDPDNWVMLTNVSAMHLDRNEIDDAIAAGQRAIALRPTHAPAWANLGVALAHRGSYPNAITVLQHALELDASNEGAWRVLAAANGQIGRSQECLGASSRALALNPNDPYALYWLAVANDALGNRTEARAALRRLWEIAPQLARDLGVAPVGAPI